MEVGWEEGLKWNGILGAVEGEEVGLGGVSKYCLRLVFPVEIPAEAVEDGLEELAAINVDHSAFAGEKTLDISGAVGGELVSGGMGFATGAMTRHDKTWVDDGANKRHTFVGKLSAALVWV